MAQKKRGLSVQRVSQIGLKGERDEKVARFAVKNKLVILTLDLDFARIYHDVFHGSLGVIVVRVKPSTPFYIIEALDATFKKIKLDEIQKNLPSSQRKK